MDNYRQVASLDQVPTGKTLVVLIEGNEVLLCHTSEGLFAVDNMCTHAAARLCEGRLRGHRILCPMHGAAFDVRSGEALSRPASVALRSYPIKLVGENIHMSIED
jgi:nitrite reductase/ring-hydroxylating ferredoxin subunit